MVRHYQRKLVQFEESYFLTVRSVTQDNKGKAKTGIDQRA